MAKPRPGMGRGLDAILSVSAEGVQHSADELRELPVELISPNPKQPRRRFEQESLAALAASLGERGCCSRCSCGRDRRRATSWSPASGAGERRASRACEHPGDRARTRGRAGAGSGARREYGARGSQPDRGGARLRCAGRGAWAHARGRGTARGAQPRGRQQPGAAARPARRCDRALVQEDSSARATGGRCCSRTVTARGAAWHAPRWRRDGRCASPKSAPARATPDPRQALPRAPMRCRRVHPDQEHAAARDGADTGRGVRFRGAGQADERRSLQRAAVVCERRGRARVGTANAAARIVPRGRLAQLVRALL